MAPLTTGVIQAILREFSQQRAGRGRYVSGPSGPATPAGITATGGVISDYPSGGNVYRAHVFTSLGTFTVSAVTGTGLVEYLVVAGGGGGGDSGGGGGGGAGGFRTNVPGTPLSTTSPFPVSTTSYPVTIGAGGNRFGGAVYSNPSEGTPGNDSSFGPPSNPQRVISSGGGAGTGYYDPGPYAGKNGGSGGGGGRGGTPNSGVVSPGGSSVSITGLSVTPTTQGNSGGQGGSYAVSYAGPDHSYGGGGGGGAGGAGGNTVIPGSSPTGTGGAGGAGLKLAIAGPPTFTGVGALNPGPGEYQWFAGGGGGGNSKQPGIGQNPGPGGVGGGGVGSGTGTNATAGQAATGGGGGGAGGNTPYLLAANGGSGIVVVRYQIASLTATAKATGGLISFYSGKTIHQFLSSGTFTVTNPGLSSVEYVVVAGGGAGGTAGSAGGGGGAGQYLYNPSYAVSTTGGPGSNGAYPITIGAGGAALSNDPGGYSTTKNPGSVSTLNGPSAITAGGGGGGSGGNTPGDNGTAGTTGTGSGGGENSGYQSSIVVGTGTPPGANPGGVAQDSSGQSGGGGGGSYAVGGAASGPGIGGIGGAGTQYPTTGNYYAGGGGGGGITGGSGGTGGGGRGSTGAGPLYATPGDQNTGGGGGGGSTQGASPPYSPEADSGSGGSGIVIIAYPS